MKIAPREPYMWGGGGETYMEGGKPRIDSVFGPPWREDYRREENKLSHTGTQGVGGFLVSIDVTL